MKNLLSFFVLILLLSSCAKDQEIQLYKPIKMDFTFTTVNNVGDRIYLQNKTQNYIGNIKWTVVNNQELHFESEDTYPSFIVNGIGEFKVNLEFLVGDSLYFMTKSFSINSPKEAFLQRVDIKEITNNHNAVFFKIKTTTIANLDYTLYDVAKTSAILMNVSQGSVSFGHAYWVPATSFKYDVYNEALNNKIYYYFEFYDQNSGDVISRSDILTNEFIGVDNSYLDFDFSAQTTDNCSGCEYFSFVAGYTYNY